VVKGIWNITKIFIVLKLANKIVKYFLINKYYTLYMKERKDK